MKYVTLPLLGLIGLISACSSPPIQPGPTPSPVVSTPGPVNFANATSKRSLNLNDLGSLASINNAVPSAGTGSDSSTPVGASPESPVAPGIGAVGQIAIGLPYSPYYGGGEFNQFIPVMAEESLFPGNSSTDLSTIYQQHIVPLLRQWDLNARLLESRGNTQPDLKDPNRYEAVYVPGLTSDQPLKLQPDWIFRLASTPRKETLTVYVTPQATRVYRVAWSEPNIAIDQVKISVDQAIAIARKALSDRNSQTDYPVYPMSELDLGDKNTIVYDLPEQLNWNVSLGQQGDQIIYYLSANYVEVFGQPGTVVIPVLNTESGQTSTGVPVSNQTTSQPEQPPTDIALDCQVNYQPYLYLSASTSINAVTGKILSLNRPVRYSNAGMPCRVVDSKPTDSTAVNPASK